MTFENILLFIRAPKWCHYAHIDRMIK